MIKKPIYFFIFSLFLYSFSFSNNILVTNIAFFSSSSSTQVYSNEVHTSIQNIYSFNFNKDPDIPEEINCFPKELVELIGFLTIENPTEENFRFKIHNDGDFKLETTSLHKHDPNLSNNYLPIDEESDISIPSTSLIKIKAKGYIPKGISSKQSSNLKIIATNSSNISKEIVLKIKTKDSFDENTLLLLEKNVNRDRANIGEILNYNIKLKNTSSSSLEKFILKDTLPAGFKLLENSFKISDKYFYNLVENKENSFKIEIYPKNSNISVDEEVEFSYSTLIKVTTKLGKNSNRILGTGFSEHNYFSTNEASAEVEIEGDNFSTRGVIFGRVFLDKNKNSLYDENIDISIPGIKIYLENGDFAISDENGKYSIFGVNSISHIVKIDSSTLPNKNIKTSKLNNRYSQDGLSTLVDLKSAQLHKANFVFSEVNNEFLSAIINRKKELNELPNEINFLLDNQDFDFETKKERKRYMDKDGYISNRKEHFFNDGLHSPSELTAESNSSFKLLSDRELEQLILSLDNKLDFINIKDGDILNEVNTIQIKGPIAGKMNLFVNNSLIPTSNIGTNAQSSTNELFFLEYNGIKLNPGENKLKIVFSDIFGNERMKKEINVIVPDIFKDFKVELSQEENPMLLKIQAIDSYGNKILHSVDITIDSPSVKILNRDLNLEKDGIQLKSNKNGFTSIYFLSPPGNKKVTFKVMCETLEKIINFNVSGKKQPLFINGIIEGRTDFNSFSNKNINFDSYLFENKLSNLNTSENLATGYRTGIFAKGTVFDDYYLTVRYDNNNEKKKYFGYVDSEEYYPIYGDNSIRGYDAQSISHLYLKMEKDSSFFLFGDFETDDWKESEEENNEEILLSSYSRILNGALFRYDSDKLKGGFFVAKTNTENFIEEIRGRGVSGPYRLKNRSILEGTEKISIVTYKKENPSIVINEKILSAMSDYSIDYDTGFIYFSKPIPSTDLDFNPIFIKINYEIEEDSSLEKYLVYGLDLEYNIFSNIYFGLNHIEDKNPNDFFKLNSGHIKATSQNYFFKLEIGETDSFEFETGQAWALAYKFEKNTIKLETIYFNADENFYNPDSFVIQNQESLDFLLEYAFTHDKILKIEGEYINDKDNNNIRKNIYGGIEKILSQEFTLDLGFRHFSETNGATEFTSSRKNEKETYNTVAAKVTWKPKIIKKFTSFLEYEQDFIQPKFKRIALGMNYSLSNNTNLYFRQQLFSNLGTDYALTPEDDEHKTIFGIETGYFSLGKIFSEYRILDDEDNPFNHEIGSGLKTDYEFSDNLKIYGTFEKILPLEKTKYIENDKENSNLYSKDSTAITFGYNYIINPKIRTTGDFEFLLENEKSFLMKLGYGQEISNSLSLIFKNKFFNENNNSKENRLSLGLAYRDTKNDIYNSLNKYEINYSKNILDNSYTHMAHILRSSHNYQFSENLISTFTFSGKYVHDTLNNISNNYLGYLISSSINYDILKKYDIGLNVALYSDKNLENKKYGVGIETGYSVHSNIWLSLGYNFLGFKDKDFDPKGTYKKGIYLRFRINIGDILTKSSNI